MAAFIETPVFPEDISIGSSFGPGYSSSIARNIAGYEFANQNWVMPLHQGDVRYGVKNQTQLDNLLAYFHKVAGRFNRFRFKNWNDYSAVTGTTGTVVAIDATHWQMYKTYIYGAISAARKIAKPRAGVTFTGGGSYTYDTTTGIITKVSGAAPTGWTGEFDFPIRFDTDKMLPVWMDFQLYRWESIPIVEIRL